MKLNLNFDNLVSSIKTKSPEILLVSGIAEWAVGTFLACKATKKIEKNEETAIGFEGSLDQKSKLAKAIDVCKAYAPAVGCMAAGTVSVCGSHGIMRKRYVGMVTAYGALTTSFMEYRSRVREEIGKEREEELYYGTKKETIPVKTVQKDGKEKKVNKKVDVRTKHGLSPYAQKLESKKMLGEDNPYYVDAYIQRIESGSNDRLKANGHLYLNDVRDELGLYKDDVGQLVGWLYDPNKFKDGDRDNYVKILVRDVYIVKEDGTYDIEKWVDFNVDGVIFGKLSQEEYNTSVKEIGDQGLEFSNKED